MIEFTPMIPDPFMKRPGTVLFKPTAMRFLEHKVILDDGALQLGGQQSGFQIFDAGRLSIRLLHSLRFYLDSPSIKTSDSSRISRVSCLSRLLQASVSMLTQ